MVLVVAESAADRALELLADRPGSAWVLGQVRPTDPQADPVGAVQGTKGVDGGTVRLVGAHSR
jgi:phosphoribosylformylglycinamidine cyclo-ligase